MANDLTLTGLPFELLLNIFDFLSPADRACLALCCHELMNIVTQGGAKPLKSLLAGHKDGDTDSELYLFLNRLSNDLPDYFSCIPCAELHLWKKVQHPGRMLFSKGVCCMSKMSQPYFHIADWDLSDAHYCLDPVHVQLAIRRYLRGPQYGIAAESLSYTEVRPEYPEVNKSFLPERGMFFRRHTATVTSIDACVFPDPASLCLRVQSLRIGLEKFVRGRHERDAAASWGDYIGLNQCTHLECFPHPQMESELEGSSPPCSRNYRQIPESPGRKFVATCDDCNTFYQFEIRRFGDGYLVFVITRYIALGPGQVQKKEWDMTRAYEDARHNLDFPYPQLRFESCPEDGRSKKILFGEDLFLRNVRLVTEHKYTEMTRLGPDSRIWFERPEMS